MRKRVWIIMMMAEKKFKKIGSTGEATSILGLNDKILNFNLAGNLYWEAVDRILELEAEVKEYQQSFDLQYDASMRGIKMWQEATGRDMVWPDKAELTAWLIERLDEKEKTLQSVEQISKRIEFKIENLVRSYKLLTSIQPEKTAVVNYFAGEETILANYFIGDEFRNTLHSIIDEQEEGEWITLIRYRPKQGE